MKQMEVTEKTIGESTFYIKPFPAFTAANLSGELAAVLAPLLGSLVPLIGDSKENEKGVLDMDVNDALPQVAKSFSSLSGDKFEELMKKLLINSKNISVETEDGKVSVLDYDLANEIFCGEIDEMYMLCFEVIKINFGGFFKKLGTRSGNLQGIIRKMVPSTENGAN